MKIIALLLTVFALVSSAVALKDAVCRLEHSVRGPCLSGHFRYWSYNAGTNECVEFHYGGCFGNKNRFKVRKDCENKCKE